LMEIKSYREILKDNHGLSIVDNNYSNEIYDNFEKAAKDYGVKHVGIAGGVAANSYLRSSLQQMGDELNIKTYVPAFEYCLDNAGMIAKVAEFKYEKGDFADLDLAPFTRVGKSL
ncbi:MAG: tRNA (adenosine(37)-N6)-threonylcarbamoyltransferase complex transferase subunit TsaD, partial [Bacteroidia bacterium]